MRKSTEKNIHLLKAAVLLLSAVFCLFMPVMTGAGLIYNRASYGDGLAFTGALFIVSAILMTAGTAICGSRTDLKNVLSVMLSFSGLVLCIVMLHRLCVHADVSGWSDKFTMEQISRMYKRRILPCIIPAVLSMILSFIGLRRKKRDTGEYTSII